MMETYTLLLLSVLGFCGLSGCEMTPEEKRERALELKAEAEHEIKEIMREGLAEGFSNPYIRNNEAEMTKLQERMMKKAEQTKNKIDKMKELDPSLKIEHPFQGVPMKESK